MKLWRITTSFSNNLINLSSSEQIKIYCQDTNEENLGDTDNPKTSRGTVVIVQGGDGEV